MHRTIQRSALTALILAALVCACDDDDDNGSTAGSQSTNDFAGASASAGRAASGAEANAGSSSVANAPSSGSTTDTGESTPSGVANAPSSGSTTDTGESTPSGVANAPSSGSTTDTGESTTSGGLPGGSVAGGNGTQTSGAITLSDAQIADVTSTLNTGEIDTSMLALTKAQSPEVRDFGQTMITAHTAAQQRQMAILKALNITPATNPVSERVKTDADALLARLQSTDDAQFDSAYMMGQVDLHTTALTLLDDQLIPQAMTPELKDDLMTMRGEVAMHLDSAKALLDCIGGTANGE